jgi:hypothetical protein
MIAAAFVACAVLSIMAFYPVATKTITEHQAEDLRRHVAELARSAAPPRTTATIWADIKKELKVRRYEDISYWDYDEAKEILKRLKTGQPRG